MKLICKKCNYKFETKGNKIPTTCPYCGATNTLVEDVNILDKILSEEEANKE